MIPAALETTPIFISLSLNHGMLLNSVVYTVYIHIYACLIEHELMSIFTGDQMVVRLAVTHSAKVHIIYVYR